MVRKERLRALEMIILDIQEEIEKEQGTIRLLQSDRRRIAEAIDVAYSVEEDRIFNIISEEFDPTFIGDRLRSVTRAISQSDKVLRVEV